MSAFRQLLGASVVVAITTACSAAQAQEVQIRLGARRTAALALLGASAAGVAAGVAFGVVSVVEHRRSLDMTDDDRTPEQQQDYQIAVDRRDDFRVASGFAGGFGLGLFLVGGALFMVDEFSPQPAAEPADEAAGDHALALEIVPRVGRGFAGAALTFRF